MTWWNIFAAAICLGLCGVAGVFGMHVLVASHAANARYSAEEKVWRALRTRGVRGNAVVVRMSRQANQLTKNGSYGNNEVAAIDLVLVYEDANGHSRQAFVATFIDLGVLANFAIGKRVAVIFERDMPERLAIDRDRTPLEIPLSVDQ